LEDILRFSRGFSDSDVVHSYAKRLRRKRAIVLAQIALSFYNKGPSIRAKNNDPLEVFVVVSLFERLSWLLWGARAKPLRWGRKSRSWAKYHGKRGQNQGFSSSICVDEALRILLANSKVPKFEYPTCLLGSKKAGETCVRKSTARTLK
jgi:hypothetical protein